MGSRAKQANIAIQSYFKWLYCTIKMSYPSFDFWKAEATAVPGKTAQLWKNSIYILL